MNTVINILAAVTMTLGLVVLLSIAAANVRLLPGRRKR